MRTGIVDKLETEYKELSQEQKDLYPNFFTAIKEVKRILPDATKVSEGPAEAVVHAITSPRPQEEVHCWKGRRLPCQMDGLLQMVHVTRLL